ncbi:hypothetical protein EMIT0111MI5_70215 [Burkholderia sp. IT-111MI5]
MPLVSDFASGGTGRTSRPNDGSIAGGWRLPTTAAPKQGEIA